MTNLILGVWIVKSLLAHIPFMNYTNHKHSYISYVWNWHQNDLILVWNWYRVRYICKRTEVIQIFMCTNRLNIISCLLELLAATKQLYEWFSPSVHLSVCTSVRLSVCVSVTHFWLCSHHHIIPKFSGVITNDRSDVHTKGQGQRSRSQRSKPNLAVSGL